MTMSDPRRGAMRREAVSTRPFALMRECRPGEETLQVGNAGY